MIDASPDRMRELWRNMAARYGVTIARKRDTLAMQLVAAALEEMGVLDADAFLERYATTIGKIIWLPREPGDPTWDALSQARLCAHEFRHVEQFDEDPSLFLRYLSSTEERALAEAEAFACNLEVEFQLTCQRDELDRPVPNTGSMPLPGQLSERLRAYAVPEDHRKLCRVALQSYAVTVGEGGMTRRPSQDVVAFLRGP